MTFDAQCTQQVSFVVLYGSDRQIELSGNLFHPLALSNQTQDLELTWCQRRRAIVDGIRHRPEDVFRDERRQIRAAVHHGGKCLEELLTGRLFEQVAGGAGTERLRREARVAVDRQEDEACERSVRLELAHGVQTVDHRHHHVGDDDVRAVRSRGFHELSTVVDDGHELCGLRNQPAQTLGDHHMVISQDHPWFHGSLSNRQGRDDGGDGLRPAPIIRRLAVPPE